MTTICWDGKELVADSRVTKLDLDGNKRIIAPMKIGDITVIGNDIAKIVMPENFLLDGDEVLAVAVAGDARLMGSLEFMGTNETWEGKSFHRDMYMTEFYSQFADISCLTEFIIIGRTKWAHAKLQARPDGSFIDFTVDLYHRDGTGWTLGGSGYLSILESIKHPNMLNNGITLESMKTKSARKNVQLGIICDPMSGGPLRVWSEGSGLQTVEIEAGVQVVKEHLEAHGYQMDMPQIDDEEALRRMAEITAERAARQAA